MKKPLTIHLTESGAGREAACGEQCYATGQLWLVRRGMVSLCFVWDRDNHRATDLSLPLELLQRVVADGHPLRTCCACLNQLSAAARGTEAGCAPLPG